MSFDFTTLRSTNKLLQTKTVTILSSIIVVQQLLSTSSKLKDSYRISIFISFRFALVFTNTTSLKLNSTNDEIEGNDKRWLFIIIGIVGISVLIVIFIILINFSYQKKEPSKDSKSIHNESLSHSRTNKSIVEDMQSYQSFDSSLTPASSSQNSQASSR